MYCPPSPSPFNSRFLVSAPRCYCLLTRVPFFELHFEMLYSHFNKNQLSGASKLFSSDMVLIHVLFNGNDLSGSIPETLGLV
ncbi:leucine-rich repeat receptor protein kinase HPCA1-like [Arachis hypogaea]